jgi:hypothetical protein
MHQTDCEPVLNRIGIEYTPEDKYNLEIIPSYSERQSLINV